MALAVPFHRFAFFIGGAGSGNTHHISTSLAPATFFASWIEIFQGWIVSSLVEAATLRHRDASVRAPDEALIAHTALLALLRASRRDLQAAAGLVTALGAMFIVTVEWTG